MISHACSREERIWGHNDQLGEDFSETSSCYSAEAKVFNLDWQDEVLLDFLINILARQVSMLEKV